MKTYTYRIVASYGMGTENEDFTVREGTVQAASAEDAEAAVRAEIESDHFWGDARHDIEVEAEGE